ncbi:MAG: HAD family hydrolase [Thiohalocapsa sp.]|jgi:HAD superfamily hydrolase (TIGR01509 family)|uniref:HAD family hydrolase n=1 Tax=Thiohalocapsa sp. TaxID=2497641 RepID=UPI0025CBD452|nr:HAD family hydrolase [Thiohalocapsa sp.]MCG6940110.1 HAD family hydrolase [Thiohalocapsa sp.]
MPELEAIIFDVDGTLADTERDGHRVAFNAAFADAGLDWEWSVPLYGDLLRVTGGKERIRTYLAEHRPEFIPPHPLDEFVKGLHGRKTEHYTRMMQGGAIGLRPGVLRLLTEAREAGLRLAIATTTTPENVTALLAAAPVAGLADWFEVIAAGDVVPAKKPAPDIFDLALQRLGLPASACVAVEDSDNGVRSALDAGLAALLVTVSSYTIRQDFSGAALVLDGLGEPAVPPRLLNGSCAATVAPVLEGAGCVDLSVLRALHGCVYTDGVE